MIKIELFQNGILIQGHAQAEDIGKDIYCAGVSAIAQGAINWFNQDDITYEIKDAYLKLKINNLTSKNVELLKLLEIQLWSLDTIEYRKYIQFIKNKKDM